MKRSLLKRPAAPWGVARGVETRAAILRAAEHIFAEKGLAGARTDAIAAAARVNKALLYYYFKDKEDLYRAIVEGHLKDFSEQALAVLSSPGPAGTTLLRYVSMHFDFISARPYYPPLLQRFMMTSERPFKRLAQKYFVPVAMGYKGLIERGIQSGEFRSTDSTHTAISLVALTVFYFSAAPILRLAGLVDPYDKVQLAQRKKEVLAFIRHALFRKGEAG